MANKREQEFRNKLWSEDPRCRFCGVETVLPPPAELNECGDAYLPQRAKPELNWATIEHLFSRLNPFRHTEAYTEMPDEHKYTLACWKCNGLRGAAEVSRLSLEEQRERAQLGPRKKRAHLPNRGIPPVRGDNTRECFIDRPDFDLDAEAGLA